MTYFVHLYNEENLYDDGGFFDILLPIKDISDVLEYGDGRCNLYVKGHTDPITINMSADTVISRIYAAQNGKKESAFICVYRANPSSREWYLETPIIHFISIDSIKYMTNVDGDIRIHRRDSLPGFSSFIPTSKEVEEVNNLIIEAQRED